MRLAREQRRDRSLRGRRTTVPLPATHTAANHRHHHRGRQTDRDTGRQQRPAWFGWRRTNVARGRREATGRGRRRRRGPTPTPRVRSPPRRRPRTAIAAMIQRREDDPAGRPAVASTDGDPGAGTAATLSGFTVASALVNTSRLSPPRASSHNGRDRKVRWAVRDSAVVETSSNESVARDQSSSPATRRMSKASGDRSPVHSIRRASTCGDVAALGEATRIAADAARCSSTTAPPVASNASTTGWTSGRSSSATISAMAGLAATASPYCGPLIGVTEYVVDSACGDTEQASVEPDVSVAVRRARGRARPRCGRRSAPSCGGRRSRASPGRGRHPARRPRRARRGRPARPCTPGRRGPPP